MSAIKDLDRRLHSVLVVRQLGGMADNRSIRAYADAIEQAPRMAVVGHLAVLALRVLRGRAVA